MPNLHSWHPHSLSGTALTEPRKKKYSTPWPRGGTPRNLGTVRRGGLWWGIIPTWWTYTCAHQGSAQRGHPMVPHWNSTEEPSGALLEGGFLPSWDIWLISRGEAWKDNKHQKWIWVLKDHFKEQYRPQSVRSKQMQTSRWIFVKETVVPHTSVWEVSIFILACLKLYGHALRSKLM